MRLLGLPPQGGDSLLPYIGDPNGSIVGFFEGPRGPQGEQGVQGEPGDYTKPGTGIPKADLASAVQTSLNLADGSLQKDVVAYNVKDHGAIGNGSTNDRAALAAADTAAIAAGLPLLFPNGTYKVSSALTIASPVVFLPSAKIKPDSAVTVSTGYVDAPPSQQVFDHSAGGKVVPANSEYHPGWWGATGGSDDSVAWNAMQASITASLVNITTGADFGKRVTAPAGVNRLFGVTLDHCTIDAGRGWSAFVPPNGTTTGVMLTLGDFAVLNSGWYGTTESGQAVTLIWQKGFRSQINDPYIANKAASSIGLVAGDSGQPSTTPMLRDVLINSGLTTPAAGSIGLDIQSPDLKANGLWVAQNDIGIRGSRAGAAMISNMHVWGNGTGITGDQWDKSRVNGYVESNRGWGVDVDKMDRANWELFVWNNGATTGSTGGVAVRQTSGSARFSKLRLFLDDNTGTGLLVDGPDDYEVDAILNSSVVQGGGAVVTTTGVSIASGTLRLRLGLSGSDATTLVSDSSTSTIYKTVAGLAHSATSKTTPVDADEIPLADSAASYGLAKLTWANLKATIATYIAGLTMTMTGKTLTTPAIDSIKDTNGATILGFSPVVSAVNYWLLNNSTGHPILTVTGTSTNINAYVRPRGTGKVGFQDGTDTTKTLTHDVSNITTSTVRTAVWPDADINVAGTTNPQTLTATRLNPRVTSTTTGSSLTPSIAVSTGKDLYAYTALAGTLTIGLPTGTPLDGNIIRYRFKDDGTSRTLSWNGAFRAIGVTIPTATTIGKTLYVTTIYNIADTKWDVIDVKQEA